MLLIITAITSPLKLLPLPRNVFEREGEKRYLEKLLGNDRLLRQVVENEKQQCRNECI